jgi:hypothetical protein
MVMPLCSYGRDGHTAKFVEVEGLVSIRGWTSLLSAGEPAKGYPDVKEVSSAGVRNMTIRPGVGIIG